MVRIKIGHFPWLEFPLRGEEYLQAIYVRRNRKVIVTNRRHYVLKFYDFKTYMIDIDEDIFKFVKIEYKESIYFIRLCNELEIKKGSIKLNQCFYIYLREFYTENTHVYIDDFLMKKPELIHTIELKLNTQINLMGNYLKEV